ncbi:MAG: Asparagine synthetase (glutamine-hydrolyzing) [Candidatus Magnetoglobus multicellularis str. Araruama]|uniref:asparagine synthase (glutamine-hydrolyzing) n=1 Tax=Candidatus Magnetoglobus multicellularis str. Araruama TaxID=890399 RepID=A0A1V1P6H6_9BACT|nr:MAG: Asparagine synthetase (glutamine-hydrolyzing) [Candidatus Magnetoglobus multicellularis str. Araruama]
MCGICGEIRFDNQYPSLSMIGAITDNMSPRGPDASGTYGQSNFLFGHRRLKIIDLSNHAQQPMVDSHLGLSIVFNGTIYNYKNLRKILEKKGYNFFSSGDTEIILKAFHAWGESCVDHFNGMFAFAIYNRKNDQLFLARDRLGIKPLYYSKTSRFFRFASSLPALLADKDIDTQIDPVALHYYMSFHSVVPAPHTIIKGIRKVKPAHTITIRSNGEIKEKKYWTLNFIARSEEKEFTFDDWKDGLKKQLEQSVIRRLTADVPVGVLLSGGLDSSLLVGLLSKMGSKGLNTFSIGFESVRGKKGDEFEYSDIIAQKFGTIHHKIAVNSDRVLPSLDLCVKSMNEPMVSHDCIGFYLLSEEVSKHVKVVQSGQGADEIFAGYHWYPPMMTSTNPVADYANVFFDRDHEEYQQAVHQRFAASNYSMDFISQSFAASGADSAIDKTLRNDITVMLIDDPVKRVDNMTMAWGLEARVPFLDHELVEFAARIPAEMKVSNHGKYILKELAREVIPSKVIDRPKGYFPVPALTYLRGDYLEKVRDILHAQSAIKRNVFNMEYIHMLLKDPENHITPLSGSKLWQVALLEFWFQTHIN